ncbi:MAG: phosphoribosylformylglycinamidine cyclo-ligase [Candidatus Deianiraeaceae bacterium]|jgi:phosphoribosylformylglycinamidine cyclo-ligase
MSNFTNLTYKQTGVDVQKGDDFVESIKKITKSSSIGMFGNIFDVSSLNMKRPILVSGTDGVGTKLKLAFKLQQHKTIGIDLVAMCVNDILCHGAKPIFFLDYLANSSVDVKVLEEIITGVNEGCKQAGCELAGGETAEMPDIYKNGEYDLAGFVVGAVEKEKILPSKNIKYGDILIALPSSGVHSNGFSLVNAVLEKTGDIANELLQTLMQPTKIYVKDVLSLLEKIDGINALAHITGGGLCSNTMRVIPESMSLKIDYSAIQTPEIFHWLQKNGNITTEEMFKVFNMGIGMVVVAEKSSVEEVLAMYDGAYVFGSVQ